MIILDETWTDWSDCRQGCVRFSCYGDNCGNPASSPVGLRTVYFHSCSNDRCSCTVVRITRIDEYMILYFRPCSPGLEAHVGAVVARQVRGRQESLPEDLLPEPGPAQALPGGLQDGQG